MAREEKLKLGKGAAFVKGRFKRLRQQDETWEVDFRALPRRVTQSQAHCLGVVVGEDASLPAHGQVEGRPTFNDRATTSATRSSWAGVARSTPRHSTR